MVDDPQYTMWKERRDAELAAERARAELRQQREALREEWQEAWEEYEVHWREGQQPRADPPWWRIRTWVRLLLGKGPGGGRNRSG